MPARLPGHFAAHLPLHCTGTKPRAAPVMAGPQSGCHPLNRVALQTPHSRGWGSAVGNVQDPPGPAGSVVSIHLLHLAGDAERPATVTQESQAAVRAEPAVPAGAALPDHQVTEDLPKGHICPQTTLLTEGALAPRPLHPPLPG